MSVVTKILTRFGLRQPIYQPYIPESIDQAVLVEQAVEFLNSSLTSGKKSYKNYREFHERQGYAGLLGERKTLCFEEAFIIYLLLERFRPRVIVEIGTQYGGSTRRIIDMKRFLGLEVEVVCFDVVSQVKHFQPDEAQLVLKDITNTFKEDVLNAYGSGLIYLDAHPYHLLKNVIQGVLRSSNWILAIHDCGRGICNPQMTISKEELNITTQTGHWERHVLAEVFGVEDVMSHKLENLETTNHRLKIFETPHGLASILPKQILAAEQLAE